MTEITILGPSGAGKTCYLYAMAERMALGVNDLTFTATNCIDALRLEEEWNKICDVGVMPPPTSCLHELHFTSSYSLAPFMEFNWSEWAGALLHTDGEENDEINILLKRVETSSGVILCIPATLLHSAMTNDRSGLRMLSAYLRLLTWFRHKGNTLPPLMLAITKADLIKEEEYENGLRHLCEEVLSPLFDPNGGCLVGIVPVSLGRDISFEGNNVVGGTINPWNVEIPPLFCIKTILEKQISELKMQLFMSPAGLVASAVAKLWVNSSGFNARLNEKMNESLRKISQMQAIVDNINQTINASNAIVFRNGQKISATKGVQK